MIKNFIERIFWIQDQLKLSCWQENRLYHTIELNKFYDTIVFKFDIMVKAYAGIEKEIIVSEQLYILENNIDVNKIIDEIKDFMDFIKTDPGGWGGAMQSIVDEILMSTEVFSNTFNKQ